MVFFAVLLLLLMGTVNSTKLCAFMYHEKEALSDEELYGDSEYSIFAEKHSKDSSQNKNTTSVKQRETAESTEPRVMATESNFSEQVIESQTTEETDKQDKEKEENPIQITLEGAEPEQYYKEDVEIKLTVENKAYQQNKTTVKNNLTDADGLVKEMEFEFAQDGVIRDDSYVLQEEGEYQFVVSVEDDKKVLKEESRHFHIDKTPPVITLDLIQKEPCYKLDVAEIKDKCVSDISPCETAVYVNGAEQADVIEEPGEYAVMVSAEDEAGNVTQQSAYVRIEEQEKSETEQFKSATSNAETTIENVLEQENCEEEKNRSMRYQKAAVPAVMMVCIIGGLWYQKERKNTRKWECDKDEIQ